MTNVLSNGLTFPIARYRFTFRAIGNLCLPQNAGSLLRGQFGALRPVLKGTEGLEMNQLTHFSFAAARDSSDPA